MDMIYKADVDPITPAPTVLQDVLQAIESWTDLPRQRRDPLASFVRRAMEIQAANARPNDGPARFTCEALNATLWRRAPACFGILTRGGFNNLVSGCRYVLIRLGAHDPEVALSPLWRALYEQLSADRRKSLVRLMRYLSANGVAPTDVSNTTLSAFEAWCTTRILKEDIGGLVRRTASGWNWAAATIPGWGQGRLQRQNMREQYTLPLDAYSPGFQADAKAFLDALAADPVEKMFTTGKLFANTSGNPRSRPKALRARTVGGREYNIRAAAAALVLTGTPADTLTSLRDLVHPLSRVETIIQFHHDRRKQREQNEEYQTRPTGLIEVIETLRQIAKFHCGLPDEHVAAIAGWGVTVTPPQQSTMSEKNHARLRALLKPDTYVQLLHLPTRLHERAGEIWKAARDGKPGMVVPPPAPAARLAMYALALEILLFCPLRRKNLVTLHMRRDLVHLGPAGRVSGLYIGADQGKTNAPYEWDVPASLGEIIRTWVTHYRPVYAEAGNPYLFPGKGIEARDQSEFGNYLGELVEREVGAEFNMHLARHFAVVRFLRRHPGQYAIVSRLLGHRNVQTTIAFYSGLEMNAAAAAVNKVVLEDKAQTRLAARAAFSKRRRKPKGGR